MSDEASHHVKHIFLRSVEPTPVLFASPTISPQRVIDALAMPTPRGLVILNGGAARLDPAIEARLAHVLQDGLARIVAEEQLTVVTGGTDAGIFHLFGAGLGRWGRSAPCVGVTVAGLVTWPGKPTGEAPLEPHHSHFVLVEGNHWGAETATMYGLVRHLDEQCPTVAVFAGGGEITVHELQMNVAHGRRMILLAGSGRATDQLLAARSGQAVSDPRLVEVAQQGELVLFDLDEPPAALGELVLRVLGLGAA
jgi:hypothetical protein